jgi:hypothetical protein
VDIESSLILRLLAPCRVLRNRCDLGAIHVGGGTAGARALRRPMARSVAAARTYGKQFQCLTGKSAVFSFAFIAPEQMRLALLQKYRC